MHSTRTPVQFVCLARRARSGVGPLQRDSGLALSVRGWPTTAIDTGGNLRAAKALGVTIPESILLQADEVIR